MGNLGPGHLLQLVQGITKHFLQLVIGLNPSFGRGCDCHADLDVLKIPAKAGLLFPDAFQHLFVLGDIFLDGQVMGGGTVR